MPNVSIASIYGGSQIDRQIAKLKRGAQIVVGTPGRIIDLIERKKLKLQNVKTLVLDEADEMLNMGFKEDVEKILKQTPSSRQTMMFSATFPQAIKALTTAYQNNAVNIEIGELNRSLASINQNYVFVNKMQKKESLKHILNKFNPYACIVFCNTKAMADEVANFLIDFKINAAALHGDLRQSQRKKVMASVKQGKENLLVATDVAARGIDINNVDYVINYDLPNNVEYFLHRIGRTARAGKSGNAITILTTNNQLKMLKDYEKQTLSNILPLELGESFKVKASERESGKFAYGKARTNRDEKSFKRYKKDNNFNFNKTNNEKKDYNKKSKSKDIYNKNFEFENKSTNKNKKTNSYVFLKNENNGFNKYDNGLKKDGKKLKTYNSGYYKDDKQNDKKEKSSYKGDYLRKNKKDSFYSFKKSSKKSKF
jgi:ATP-dependent RNA helicase DeaD